MKSPISRKFSAQVGPKMGQLLKEHFPGRAAPKRLAYEIGAHEDTARMMLAGTIPHAEYLLATMANLGWDYIRDLLTPIAGDQPTQAEIADAARLLARRSSPDAEELVDLVLAQAGADDTRAALAPLAPAHQEGGPRDDAARAGTGLGSARIVVNQGSLADVAGTRSHLAAHLRRWAESSGLAERASVIAAAKATPEHRVSVKTLDGDKLVYSYVSPAFRLYGSRHDALIGRATTDGVYDRDYAEICSARSREVIESGKPAVDEVRARVKVEPGVFFDINYRRLLAPYAERGMRYLLCASEPLTGTA